MHNDAYATDAYEVSGPLGRKLQVRSATYGVSECATMGFDAKRRIVGLCGGLQGFTMRLIDPTTLEEITSLDMPARDLTTGNNPLSDLCGGAYFYLDKWNRAYVLTTTNEIWQVTITATGLKHTATYSPEIPEGDCMIATMPDWKNRIFFATKGGRIGTVDSSTGVSRIRAFPGEAIFNSMAADETGAVYAVTDHRLLTLVADKSGYPQVRWSAAYDRGTRTKPGQLSQGSGTTPTLLGKDVVAITDNAEPRMNVLFYKRSGSAKDRLICKAPVFGSGTSATENSLVMAGKTSVIVENNYGYEGPQSTIGGKTTSPGRGSRRPRRRQVQGRVDQQRVGADLGAEGVARQRPALRVHQEGLDPARRQLVLHRHRRTHRSHPVEPAHRQRHPVEQPLRVDLPRPGRCGVHAHDGRPGQVQGHARLSQVSRTTIQSAAPSSTRNRM